MIAERRYYVVSDLRTAASRPAELAGAVRGTTIVPAGDGAATLVIENRSPYYLQAQAKRDNPDEWERGQPWVGEPARGSLVLRARLAGGAASAGELRVLLPQDVPPRSSLELQLSDVALGLPGAPVDIVPEFAGVVATGSVEPLVTARPGGGPAR